MCWNQTLGHDLKIWILQTGEPLPIDQNGLRPMRAINLTEELVRRGHEVTIWASNFDHFSKKHRFSGAKTVKIDENLTIKLIHSRGYKSHAGIGRIVDHFQMAFNLRQMLKKETEPDLAFMGFPPIETAWVMASWMKKREIPTILDVKDIWPEIFLKSFPKVLRPLARFILSPFFMARDRTFRRVSNFSSVTDEFLDWCLTLAGRRRNEADAVNFLTARPLIFTEIELGKARNELDSLKIFDDGRIRGSFIGTLNSAFDFRPIIEAAKNSDIEFVIAGDGPLFNTLKEMSTSNPNLSLIGWINTAQAHELSRRSTFLFAPYLPSEDFNISIPNKFFDAMFHGKPILTSAEGVARSLVREKNIGFIYDYDNLDSLKISLNEIKAQPKAIKLKSYNARELYEKNFSYEKVYGELVSNIEKIVLNNLK